MDARENILRAVRFERPESIPMIFHINPACWHHYQQSALQDMMEAHPDLFPDFQRSETPIEPEYLPYARAGIEFTDPWGCVWQTTDNGIVGTVTQHPLESWRDFDNFTPPDPNRFDHWGPIDWSQKAQEASQLGFKRQITAGEIGHGHTFLKLTDLRGYQNLLYDMADGEPLLGRLIALLEEFNLRLVHNYIREARVEWMGYGEDLGMQIGPMLSPDHFRKYIKPSYRRIVQPARESGCVVHMHSDGDIRLLVEDLIDVGFDVLNLQDLVNGIDWIKENLAGKVCVDLDIDRQRITFAGTPGQIDALIREEVEKLGSKQGGLMMIYGLYPGVPLENVQALMDAMERYMGYYA
jgi:uroporphyrinogen decarboxylase